jgi:hypothetical protein
MPESDTVMLCLGCVLLMLLGLAIASHPYVALVMRQITSVIFAISARGAFLLRCSCVPSLLLAACALVRMGGVLVLQQHRVTLTP